MKVLLIGYGSIGKRHYEVLKTLSQINIIDIVTKQDIKSIICFKTLELVENIEHYDYFVIASPTHKHLEHLKYIDKKVKNKIIFCEKPLFHTKIDMNITNNKVFVGYVLRFHPLLKKLSQYLKNEKIIMATAKCGQYLPIWRPDTEYKNSYSAKKDEGGGVLLDLSHELDYIQWICGSLSEIKSYQVQISDLEITSDDLTMLIGKSDKNIYVNISIDYISKKTHRSLQIETLENTYQLDFITNRLIKRDKIGLEEIYTFNNLEKNYMFEQMHLDIFNSQKNICTFDEAINLMKSIFEIQEQNK